MATTNGRLENEIKVLNRVSNKIKDLPDVIKDYFYYLEAADKSYTTINTYISYVIHFMEYCNGHIMCDDFYKRVTPSKINEYMSSMRYKTGPDGTSVKTGNSIRATRWSSLNTFFSFLKLNQLIDNNPMEQTLRPSNKHDKSVVYLTEKEIQKCIDEVTKTSKNKMFTNRDICIISLGVSIGLRVSAIVQIDLDDIDLENNTIKVVEKGNKYRVMNFGDNLKEKIILWLDDRSKYFCGADTNALFISKKRNRISVSAVEDMIGKYTKDIGKHITPHKLRATCATNLYKKTGDIYMVANQLGHANIATSKIYTEIDHESKLKATNILDNLIK